MTYSGTSQQATQELLFFYGFAILGTYLIWGSLALHQRKIISWKPPSAFLHLGGNFPLFGSLLFTFLAGGFAGLSNFIANFYSLIDYHWFNISVFISMLLVFLGVLLSKVSFIGKKPEFEKLEAKHFAILIFAFVFCMIAIVGEEAGWRGYALLRLLFLFDGDLLIPSIISGTIWALWHLPIFYWDEYPLVVKGYQSSDVIKNMIYYSLGLSSVSYLMAYVYTHTNGSGICMLAIHSSINATTAALGVKNLNNLFLNIFIVSIPVLYQLTV